jgi:hypothetical protein
MFDISGTDRESTVLYSLFDYRVQVRVNGQQLVMPWDADLVVDPVLASMASTQLSFNAARVTFAIHNTKDVAETVAIAVDSEIWLDSADSAAVMSVGSNGVSVVYWFGRAVDLTTHYWDEVESDCYFGSESGFAPEHLNSAQRENQQVIDCDFYPSISE